MSEDSESDLFRREALMAASDRYGSPVPPFGLANWAVVTFMCLLLVVAVIFLLTANYARKETVTGALEPTAGALLVTSTRSGVIAKVHVSEGAAVRRGDPLVTLATDATLESGSKLSALVEAAAEKQLEAIDLQDGARSELYRRQREERLVKRKALQADAERLQASLELQQDRITLAEQTLAAAASLHAQQLMASLQYRQRQDALLVARQGLASIERERAAVQSALAENETLMQQLVAEQRGGEANSLGARAQLMEKRAELGAEKGTVLLAERDGRIAALQARAGSPVSAGAPLAYVLPRGVELRAELWVPSRAAGFVRAGDRVRLMYDSFPYQRFGAGRGQVMEMAGAPSTPINSPVRTAADEALYRVVVRLDEQDIAAYGKRWPLSPGMRLTADLVLEKQSLMAWLFDRVYAVRARAASV